MPVKKKATTKKVTKKTSKVKTKKKVESYLGETSIIHFKTSKQLLKNND